MCKYYIAYGSNLNIQQMKLRCPNARVVGETILHGYRLRFRGNPCDAVATIEPAEGYYVPVGIWRISDADEAALDIYEGYPHLYRKETMLIMLDEQPISAMVYILARDYPYNAPCFAYLRTIRDGYIAFGMNTSVLSRAVAKTMEVNRYDRQDS